MADISEITKTKILESAKKEFLEKGFTAASLRTIAANAGLTTGAMYRHFKDKDALFCALVDDAIDFTNEMINHAGRQNHENIETLQKHADEEMENMNTFIEYIYSNFDAFVLLFTKSAGSTHENFLEQISDDFTEKCMETVEWSVEKFSITKKIDKMSIHVLATSIVRAYSEIIFHNMEKEEAFTFMNNIQEFFHFGFMHMLGLKCD